MLSCPSPRSILGYANVLVEMREREVFTVVEGINPRYVGDNAVLQSQTSFLANFHKTTWSAKDGFARGGNTTSNSWHCILQSPDVFT